MKWGFRADLFQLPAGGMGPMPKDSSWFVYLLRCVDGSLYTGITNDLARRCSQHSRGTASRYTRSRLPVALVYHEPQESRGLALRREVAIKRLTRTEKESLVRKAG
jgi:predicted GIY-YIG superfamily endonuclease